MIKIEDITLVICVRLHEGNQWVADRLRFIGSYYEPKLRILIVDFGSQACYQESIKSICSEYDYQYFRVEDCGVFSAAIARNRGFEQVTTDLVLFSDIDFVFKRNFISDLIDMANALDMRDNIDVFFDFPAYHLSERATAEFERLGASSARSSFLQRIGFTGVLENQNMNTEFIAPYSNVFLMNAKLFSLVGGYHESFRGHGSEDFEFFVRLACHAKIHPLPEAVIEDKFGPTKRDFFSVKGYQGFRRLNEALAMPSELMGLKAFHLFHPTGMQSDWRESNDWRRDRFRAVVGGYIDAHHHLLKIDFIDRPRTALCICRHPEHFGYFSPLRLFGYKLTPVFDDQPETLDFFRRAIANKDFDAFVIFNPYMKSHEQFHPLFVLARECGVKTIVVERGALPGSIYYADDVSYTSPEFSVRCFDLYQPSLADLSQADSYMAAIRWGDSLLESGEPYANTVARYSVVSTATQLKCFIPLQLDDDMAVTKFVRDSQCYVDFVASLNTVIQSHPAITFLIKPHPLSKLAPNAGADNVIFIDREANIHALIDTCDFVVCYNSGVGLLSLIHGKPLVAIGNAFYNVPGTGRFADSFEAAVLLGRECLAPESYVVRKLVAWYLKVRYSTFIARDDVVEFEHRKAHAYKDILVTRLVLDDMAVETQRLAAKSTQDGRSYLYAKMNVNAPDATAAHHQRRELLATHLSPQKRRERLIRKLKNDPYIYFNDSKHGFLRFFRFAFAKNKFGKFNTRIIRKLLT